jgi:hypothetical protein
MIKLASDLELLQSKNNHTDIWVFDINSTITLFDTVDPDKTPEITNYKIVAQNIYLKNESNISLEAYIKTINTITSEEYKIYNRLPEYAKSLYLKGLLSYEDLNIIPYLYNKYKLANENICLKHEGIFPSFFKFIDFIIDKYNTPPIIFQSFGLDIAFILDVMEKRYLGKLNIVKDIGIFDDKGYLHFKGEIYKTPTEIEKLISSQKVMAWQNNYDAKGKKLLFFRDVNGKSIKTHFFDDYGDKYAIIAHNGDLLSKEDCEFAKSFIYKISTGHALTDENYFIDLYLKQRALFC